jgi:hypothetical protein
VSRHEIDDDQYTWVVGWDQPLSTFFLQRFSKGDPDSGADFWLGATPATQMYEVEELATTALKCGLVIDRKLQAVLYADKDEGR